MANAAHPMIPNIPNNGQTKNATKQPASNVSIEPCAVMACTPNHQTLTPS